MTPPSIQATRGPHGWPMAWAVAAWMGACLVLWLAMGWRIRPGQWLLPIEFPDGAPVAQLRALVGAGATLLACAGWGVIALRLMGGLAPRDFRERLLLGALLGSALGSLVVFAVGIVGLLPWGLLLFLAGAAGLSWAMPQRVEGRGSGWGAWWLIGGVGALALLPALAPVVESDGLRYHVFAPQEYLKAGAIVALPHNAFTNLPSQLQMLYLPAMWLGNERATQLVHGAHLMALMLASGLLGQRLARHWRLGADGQQRAFAAAALLVGTMPVAMVLAGWPFVDLASAAFATAAYLVAMPGVMRRAEARGALAGLLAGGAVAVKLSALLAVAPAALVLLAGATSRRRAVGALMAFGVAAAVLPAPWILRNLANHGNPLYPAAYGVFGGSEWSEEADAFYKSKAGAKGFGKAPIDLVLSPLDVTVRWSDSERRPDDFPARDLAAVESLWWRVTTRRSPGFEDQNPGPALLAMLMVALVGLGVATARARRRALPAALLIAILAGWAAWFASYQSVRFLVPVAALVFAAAASLLVAMSHRTGPRAARVLDAGVLALSLGGAAWWGVYTVAVAPSRPLHSALGLLPADEMIAGRFNAYAAVQWLNTSVAPGERVVYIGEHRGLYAQYPLEHSDWFDVPLIAAEMRATPDNDALLAAWRARGVRYVLVNMAELSLYIQSDFRPRLSDEEWRRFEALMGELLVPERLAFSPREGVFVVDLGTPKAP